MGTSALGFQLRTADDFLRWGRRWMQRGTATAAPGEVLSLGGAFEHGSDKTNAATLPFGYAHSMTDDLFLNVNGASPSPPLPARASSP
jgi:hypothetical protein